MKKYIFVFLIVVLVVEMYLILNSSEGKKDIKVERIGNVFMEGNKQVIEINVRGGYSPRVSEATSGIPTIIRMKTKNTFDCSSAVSIPSLKINTYLENTGSKDFDIGVQEPGMLSGMCSMGMYNFSIDFK